MPGSIPPPRAAWWIGGSASWTPTPAFLSPIGVEGPGPNEQDPAPSSGGGGAGERAAGAFRAVAPRPPQPRGDPDMMSRDIGAVILRIEIASRVLRAFGDAVLSLTGDREVPWTELRHLSGGELEDAADDFARALLA